MKLIMHSFDFEECTLTFSVPESIMSTRGFGYVPGGVEVDLFAITKDATLKTPQPTICECGDHIKDGDFHIHKDGKNYCETCAEIEA